MDQKTILLTGASGFLGSHLAEELSHRNYRVVALTRTTSDLWRCKEFESDKLIYVNMDVKGLKENVQRYDPFILIHAAWQGVTGKERGDQQTQWQNILLAEQLLTLSRDLGIKKAICFGSQAEYGNFKGRVNEDALCSPVSAYGKAKLEVLNIFRSFCESNSMTWFWIRLFSVYGTREGNSWLLPSVIRNVLAGRPMDLTGCEQHYDYLYVKDFTRAVLGVLETESASGIFNLGSNSSVHLRSLIENIKNSIDPAAVLNFGALSYASDQVMHMEGDSEKFYKQFNFRVGSEFDENIAEVVNYYKNTIKVK